MNRGFWVADLRSECALFADLQLFCMVLCVIRRPAYPSRLWCFIRNGILKARDANASVSFWQRGKMPRQITSPVDRWMRCYAGQPVGYWAY
jgi:hypothetical protein